MGLERYNITQVSGIAPIDENGTITTFSTTGSAVQILTTAKLGREAVLFQHIGSTVTIFLGHTSAVTVSGATRGWRILPGGDLSLDFGEDVDFWLIASGVEADALQAWEM